MAKRDRGTLKRFFEKGALPSADHFADLLDSTLNIRDDGFSKTPNEGLQLSSLENKEALMSFYHRVDFDEAVWSIKFSEQAANNIDFVSNVPAAQSATEAVLPQAVVSLNPNGFVGINNSTPSSALDVNGTIKAKAIMGIEEQPVMADGNWYNVSEGLQGAHCFEITAAVGIPNTSMYAILNCTAVGMFEKTSKWRHMFSFSKRFKKQHVAYSQFSHRIKIRWHRQDNGLYYLQLGTRCDYNYFAKKQNQPINDGIRVRFHIRSLWQDHSLQSCNTPLSEHELAAIQAQSAPDAAKGKQK